MAKNEIHNNCGYCEAGIVEDHTEEAKMSADTKMKVMSATDLILCLSGELGVDPALLVETISDDKDLKHIIISYGHGDLTYSQVLDTIVSGDYF